MDFRTDLAIEKCENFSAARIPGVRTETRRTGAAQVTKIVIGDQRGADALGQPQGTYITAEIPPLTTSAAEDESLFCTLGGLLASLLPKTGTVLTVGLGNESITPDALGPRSCEQILATRHISGALAESVGLGNLRPSAVLAPGVLGQTGVETAEIIQGLVQLLRPAAVVVIDALAARRVSRLGCTVQMTDTGIVPGSGVGNARCAINRQTLGIPVISVGVPTVVDAQTLVNDLTGKQNGNTHTIKESMIVTSREIDLVIERAAKIVGMMINRALQPHISVEEMLMLLG